MRSVGRARRIPAALSSQYIHVLSFARFECMLNAFEKASELTHAMRIAREEIGEMIVRVELFW